jgi:hypothetical protein
MLRVDTRRCEYGRQPVMFATGLGIAGRDAQLAGVARFLGGAPEQEAYALLLEGELGIDKSTVLQASLALARERHYRVLSCAPSNREAAAALFVTVKTVEAALSLVYHKLGVRSRAELARRFADSSERDIRSRPRT